MDMKSLLEKMMKFAGGADQKSGPAGQLRGGAKMPKKGGKHPAYHKLVGDSVEPEGNMLGELADEAKAKSLEWSLAEAWAEFKEEAFKDTAERRPARKGSRPSRGHEPVPGYKKVGEGDCIDKEKITKFHKKLDTLVHSTFGKRKDEMEESAEQLNVGDDVIITGPVEHKGETGVIDSFGQDNRFVVVNLYNHGKKSFHSSDVSYNDYADSDAEEAEMYDRDPEFRDWAARQEVDESQGDPHKILINKLRDIERKPSVPSADNDAARAEQARADYAKYVAKMKKKDPNFVPLYKMDEYGAAGTSSAAQTTSTSTTPTATASPEEKQKAAKMTQAATTMKSAIGTTAPTTSVVKALDTATQGKTVGSQDMKILEPMMKDMATVAQEPRLANQFKTLVNQINQTQRQQAK